MNNMKQIESQIFTGIIALCSSLLTNTFINFASETNYILTVSDGKLLLKSLPMSFYTLILNIIHIISVFFIIFILLFFVFKTAIKIYKKIHTRKFKAADEKTLIDIAFSLKQKSMNLYEKLSLDDCSVVQDSLIKLNLKELNSIILQLNNCFSNPQKNESKKIKKVFRKQNASSYVSSVTALSYYELEGIIDLLQFMLNKAITVSSHDPLLKSDCENMLMLLQNLKTSLINA